MGLFGKSKDKSRWPTAIATMDEIGLDGDRVNVSGAYVVEGEYYTVELERSFRSVRDAEAWAALIEASPKITVKFDPQDPTKYELEDDPR
jgi:hypothetical protein